MSLKFFGGNKLQGRIIKMLTRQGSKKFLSIAAFVILGGALIGLAGCSSASQGTATIAAPSQAAQPAPATTAAPTPSTTTPTASAASNTAGAFADQGSALFALACAGCHGNNGTGGGAPELTGPKNTLAAYKNAKNVLDYITASMPPEAPGSLTSPQAQQLTAFILVQNNLISRGATWDPGQLSNIVIK